MRKREIVIDWSSNLSNIFNLCSFLFLFSFLSPFLLHFRYRPLMSPSLSSDSSLSSFVHKIFTEVCFPLSLLLCTFPNSFLFQKTKCIDDTLAGRPSFAEAVTKEKEMQNVLIDNFIGLGAVRFYPSFLPKGEDDLSPEMKKEVDVLNSRYV